MTIFCLSSNTLDPLERLEGTLKLTGLEVAQSSHKSADISIQQWQTLVLAQLPSNSEVNRDMASLGKKHKKLALEIFAANADRDCYWASYDSLYFIDFMMTLESKLACILAYTDIRTHLQNLLEQGKLEQQEISSLIETWVVRTERIRLLKKIHPDRFLIVWSGSPDKEIASIAYDFIKKWANTPPALAATEVHKHVVPDHLSGYIINQILTQYPDAVQLDKIMAGALSSSNVAISPSDPATLTQAITQYNSSRQEAAFVDSSKHISSRLELNALITQKFEALETEKLSLQGSFSQLAETHERFVEDTKKQLAGYQQENLSIINQLHNCQETLEQVHDSNRTFARLNKGLTSALSSLAKECGNYWHFDKLKVIATPDSSDKHSQWIIENVMIEGRLIPSIRFHTCTINGNFGIVFHQPFKEWLTTKKDASGGDQLLCAPQKGTIYSGNNISLTTLSTTSWRMLKTLLEKITSEIQSPERMDLDSGIDSVILQRNLINLNQAIMSWPEVLRYDDISILANFDTDNYHRLELKLVNASIYETHWDKLYYNIASLGIKGPTSVHHPRLEFPESKDHSGLDSWYPETVDQRGARLELRFAQPNVMDTEVWERLSRKDKILVTSLITSINLQLVDLVRGLSLDKSDYQKWNALGTMIRTIMSKNPNISIS